MSTNNSRSKANSSHGKGLGKQLLGNMLNGGLKGSEKPNNFIASIQEQKADAQGEKVKEPVQVADEPKQVEEPVQVTDEPKQVEEPVQVADEPKQVKEPVQVADEPKQVKEPVQVADEPKQVKEPVQVADEPKQVEEPVQVADDNSTKSAAIQINSAQAKPSKRGIYRFKKMIKLNPGEDHIAKATVYMDYATFQTFKSKLSQDVDRKISFVGFTELMVLACLNDVIDIEKITKELHKKGIIEIY